MKIYQIGGSVRDKILGITPNDKDYVVIGSNIDEMKSLGFIQVGKSFPVFLHPETKEEYALARKEIKTGTGHRDFKFIFDDNITLEEDVQRRDFTCNALAYDEKNDKIIDLVGGINDINNKILRHINTNHFPEDPLRILRMCRFCAKLNFKIANETLELTKQMVRDNLLDYLSKERIWQEIENALNNKNFNIFLSALDKCDALEKLLPEFNVLLNTDLINELEKVPSITPEIKFAILVYNTTPYNALNKLYSRIMIPKKYILTIKKLYLYYNDFYNLTIENKEEIILFLDNIGAFTSLQELNKFLLIYKYCQTDIAKFKKSEELCLSTYEILKNIKPQNMENFEQIPKDKNFKNIFNKYRLSILEKKL